MIIFSLLKQKQKWLQNLMDLYMPAIVQFRCDLSSIINDFHISVAQSVKYHVVSILWAEKMIKNH